MGKVFLCEEAPNHPSDGHDRRRMCSRAPPARKRCAKICLMVMVMLTTAQADGDMMQTASVCPSPIR
eukprot:4875460-Prymnesium_polylepis.1